MQYFFNWATVFLYTFFIFYLSLIPKPPKIFTTFSFADKIFHCLAYLLLTFIVLNTSLLKRIKFPYFFSFFYGFFVGLAIEILQLFTVYRGFQFSDLVANLIGILFGLRFKLI